MKKLYFGLGLLCLLGACKTAEVSEGLPTLKLEDKIGSAEDQAKASDFFEKIDYLPLETTEEGLIGMNPAFHFYRDYIIVGSSKSKCLVFNRRDGKFIRSIGSLEKGPRGYSSSEDLWINPQNGVIYLRDWRNDYVKYSVEGDFLGVQALPEGVGQSKTVTYLGDDLLVVYPQELMGNKPERLIYVDSLGNKVKSFPGTIIKDTLGMTEISAMSIYPSSFLFKMLGMTSGKMLVIGGRGPEVELVSLSEQPVFWHNGGKTWFKESLSDTIFEVTPTAMKPARVLDLGKYRLDVKDLLNRPARKDHTTIDQVYENDRYMFFTYWFRPDAKSFAAYRGIWDKKTGDLRILKVGKDYVNDLDGFMDVNFMKIMPDQNFAGYILPLTIQEWFEENPDKAATLKPEIRKLQKLKEDDNPVLVILKSK